MLLSDDKTKIYQRIYYFYPEETVFYDEKYVREGSFSLPYGSTCLRFCTTRKQYGAGQYLPHKQV